MRGRSGDRLPDLLVVERDALLCTTKEVHDHYDQQDDNQDAYQPVTHFLVLLQFIQGRFDKRAYPVLGASNLWFVRRRGALLFCVAPLSIVVVLVVVLSRVSVRVFERISCRSSSRFSWWVPP